MNEQDAVVLPILAAIVALIVLGFVVFFLARLAGALIEHNNKNRELFKARGNEAMISYRYDPAGDTLKYAVSAYIIMATMIMTFMCCILPIVSLIFTWITGKAISDLLPPQRTLPPTWSP